MRLPETRVPGRETDRLGAQHRVDAGPSISAVSNSSRSRPARSGRCSRVARQHRVGSHRASPEASNTAVAIRAGTRAD
jgi:hypothetical protein